MGHYRGEMVSEDEDRRKRTQRIHSSPPPFQTEKGLQFFAKDSDGQWFYVNHAGTWQTCPPPVQS
ncbi:hypothetical protein [Teichococcus vastitatis]|uniref:hypothetical protein n=1 Tax=Teichococcus vastitatis TaxID=2307076 RepID=UPI000E70DF6A|nr:hypothetical protein [Pseudoroseomonas vastitatis]